MLDFFSIFSKGGILLWCFKGRANVLNSKKPNFWKKWGSLFLKALDRSWELVIIVQLSYVGKTWWTHNPISTKSINHPIFLTDTMLSAAEWETFTPTINELIKWGNFQNPDLIKKKRRQLINFYLKLKTHPKMRAVTRESWQSKLLGETRRAAGSQVQAGWSTIDNIFDKHYHIKASKCGHNQYFHPYIIHDWFMIISK